MSDRCARGEAVDRSGPALRALIGDSTVFNGVCDHAVTVSDDCDKITVRIFVRVTDDRPCAQDTLSQLNTTTNIDLIITTGGTGFAPRDVTPEVCVQCARA